MIKKWNEFIKESFQDIDDLNFDAGVVKLRKQLTGKKIELVRMDDNLKKGDKGTCTGVDDRGQILMKWENGSTLSILPEYDEFDVID